MLSEARLLLRAPDALSDAAGDEPTVEILAGREAVTFDGSRTFLQSDIVTPESVTRINPVTVEMWVYNPEVGNAETVFSLAPRQAFATAFLEDVVQRDLEVRYFQGEETRPGAVSTGFRSRSIGWKDGQHPEAGKWHHIAFVYDGKQQGWGKVYVDGELANSRGFYTMCTNSGLPVFPGAPSRRAEAFGH